jgi:hypothetical protein
MPLIFLGVNMVFVKQTVLVYVYISIKKSKTNLMHFS